MFTLLCTVSTAAAEEKRILLKHDLPSKVEVGSTVKVTLRFTDESGMAVEPYTVEVSVTSPFGFETSPPLHEEEVGVYSFTQMFDVEGAYYITIRASRYEYISYSSRLLVDCVKGKAFLEWLWAFLNSPVVFAFVIAPVSALLLYSRLKKKRGKKK